VEYDVIIIGAGPGGSSTATFLARNGFQVLLIDSATFPREKVCGDGVTPKGVEILGKLGVLDQLNDKVAHRINYAKIISPNGRTLTSAIQKTEESCKYMFTIPRFELDHILLKNAVSEGAEFRGSCKVGAIENKADHVIVHGQSNGEECLFRGKYAVIATGANMGLLRKHGFLTKKPKPVIAARSYYENSHAETDCFNFHFNDVPLPGYGWIFPMANNKINVGVGIIAKKNAPQAHISEVYSNFVDQPYMRDILAGATRLTELQTYPIRTDFLSATLYKERTLLVGEAAGLVNPLTGEGIDYAMESGGIAAEHLSQLLQTGGSPDRLILYAEALRENFTPIFKFSAQIVKSCLNPFMLNTMIAASGKRSSLGEASMDIVLGIRKPPADMSAWKILIKIFKHLKRF
jgi:geranylgeranyl reductase family protein